ncbi:hypothetical protein CEXT_590641 [Caerostris extrusa]|uniref:Uncharacterized protein n=1 Tax=Caerostris extrusa TaxID=172846 RepID=A0AAV4XGA8_CAEEX|nr:hypothetical protein CEXT_590641 [Caerostris extrusa]
MRRKDSTVSYPILSDVKDEQRNRILTRVRVGEGGFRENASALIHGIADVKGSDGLQIAFADNDMPALTDCY